MWLIKKIASIRFTVIIIVLLMIILTISTTMESKFGTPLAQRIFYQTRWFDLFLSLLWLNIFCATVLRFPFKKHQFGFLITHLGILGLLLGSLLTRLLGIEGQLFVYEGEKGSKLKIGGKKEEVTLPSKKKEVFDLKPGKYPLWRHKNSSIEVRLLEHAAEETVVAPGDSTASLNRALQVHLKSEKMGLDQSSWLVERDQNNEQGNKVAVGPLTLLLKEKKEIKAEGPPKLIITNKDGKTLASINLNEPAGEFALTGTPLKLVNLNYYPYARVGDEKIVNGPDQGPANPAVEFDVEDKNGQKEHYLKFALFPDFESMHAKGVTHQFDIQTKFDIPAAAEPLPSGAYIAFFFDAQGNWNYAVKGQTRSSDGKIALNDWVDSGLMDLRFKVEQVLDRATISTRIIDLPGGSTQGAQAIEVIAKNGQEQYSEWVMKDESLGFHTPYGDVKMNFRLKTMILPFSLALKDFRREDYPGTNSPSSFESDVALKDSQLKHEIHETIAMNKPLDYKGFRIFQSSYVQNPGEKEASVFTVAKNPGIPFIYLSAFLIFIGSFFQFYVKPLSKHAFK